MPRVVSIWLKNWPIARLSLTRNVSAAQAEAFDIHRPLVLVAPGKGGARLVALNKAARACGLVRGELLSNARSKAADLQTRVADPAADAAALRKLALWCLRYTPLVTAWDDANGADGLFLDIAGCAHLYGGEERLRDDLAHRLRCFGLVARIAIADTAGAAWAVAHHGNENRMVIAPEGQEEAVRSLPLAALRLPDETLALLHRLGFRRIGDLLRKPRAPLAARFGAALLLRLDQALGYAADPLQPACPPPRYHARLSFAEPIVSEEHVTEATRRLLAVLKESLSQDGVGARKLRLLLFRVDGEVASLDIGLARPSRDAEHLAQLISLCLGRLSGGLDAGFGFEAAALHVTVAGPLADRQTSLHSESHDDVGNEARLIDRLAQRLGKDAISRLHPRQSHIPERAVVARHAADSAFSVWSSDRPAAARPLQLLTRPEEVGEVMALIPEGPPRRFRWRGVLHQVQHAEGPERIAPEWWRRAEADVERDYYVVEDGNGHRFWLFRAGFYKDGALAPRWFMHGVFA